MQKTLDILEKNVQWIVLGLAALFLVWVAYGYVITPPAEVKIGNRLVTPGEVALVVKSSADELESQIKENKPVSFPTPDLVTAWRDHFAKPFGIELASAYFTSQPMSSEFVGPGTSTPGAPTIAALPQPPAPQLLPPMTGLSSVVTQAPIIPQNGNANGNGIPPAPPAPVPAAASAKDTVWITQPAVISARALDDALLKPFNAPPNAAPNPAIGAFYNTMILRVVLEREQSTGTKDGVPTWPAAGVEIGELSAEQPFMMAVPGSSADMNTKYQYIDWAKANQTLLCNPLFYQVTAGDPWTLPQQPAPAAPGAIPPAAPPAGAPAPANTPAPAAAQPGGVPAPANTPASATPNSAGLRIPGSASYAPVDPNRPPGEGWPPGRNPRFMQRNPGMIMPPGGNGNNAGVINPFNLNTDILVWVIDETVTPGQTYRYRIKYEIKNPVFDVKQMAPDKLTQELVITSPPSNWGDPIKAPPITKFWLSNAQKDQADLDVFQYVNGEWKKNNLKASPGDVIPGTNLTLVDVRPVEPGHGGGDKYVLLTSDTGDILRHDLNADKADPDYQTMLNPNPNGPNNARPLPPQFRPGLRPPPGSIRPAIGH